MRILFHTNYLIRNILNAQFVIIRPKNDTVNMIIFISENSHIDEGVQRIHKYHTLVRPLHQLKSHNYVVTRPRRFGECVVHACAPHIHTPRTTRVLAILIRHCTWKNSERTWLIYPVPPVHNRHRSAFAYNCWLVIECNVWTQYGRHKFQYG